jgi:hypothetical protein
MNSIVKSLITQHSGKWYEVVTYCKDIDDNGTIQAKFITPIDALIYADRIANTCHGLYTLIIIR